MIVAYTNIPSLFEDGNGTRFQLYLQIGGGATNPVVLAPRILLRKCKSNPIPPPPTLPDGPDKCIAKDKDKPGC